MSNAVGGAIHVFSLKNFATVASRFDTAGDLVTFLELRQEIAANEEYRVQAEEGNIQRMLPHIESVLSAHFSRSNVSSEIIKKTVEARIEIATGRLLQSPDWKYGLAIDDMIAHAHNLDSSLEYNTGNGAAREVAKFLGWLTRDRRIRLGKRLLSKCIEVRDGKPRYFSHVQESRGTACVYLVSADSREDRVKQLEILLAAAYMKYGMRQCLGIATEPIGPGRSYDFVIVRSSPPAELLAKLRTMDDLFDSDGSL
jgi:hypothetical protein